MINIIDNAKDQQIYPLFRLGFRPFFLFGSMFAFVAMLFWLATIQGFVSFTPINGMFWWHGHEMLFGFVSAIVAGFLLTAVQNWTGIPSIKGKILIFLCFIWMLARVLIFFNTGLPIFIVAAIDLSFLPLVAYFLGRPVVAIKQFRNLIFIPVLTLMTVANLFTYLPSWGYEANYLQKGLHSMIFLVTFLVALIGGRVIPMFTANGTQTKKATPIKLIEIPALIFLLFISFAIVLDANAQFIGALCAVASVLHFIRSLNWRPWVTLNVPLVWCLHLSMVFIPIGLALLATHYIFNTISVSTALHSLTVGVIGGMIIAMISRVSLGHTGRLLKPSPIMTFAFLSIALAAIFRSLIIVIYPSLLVYAWWISGLFWCISFGCFILVYWPLLTQPRVDGRPG